MASKINDLLAGSDAFGLTEVLALDLFSNLGITVQRSWVANNQMVAVEIANKIGYPVAIKIYSNQFFHKSDVGGVILNVNSQAGVKRACIKIKKNIT